MKKSLVFILKILFLIIIFSWIVIVFVDYFRVKQNKNPMFCISEVDKEYEDGTSHICTGAGYKMIKYNRSCITATEFGPFFIKERDCNNEN